MARRVVLAKKRPPRPRKPRLIGQPEETAASLAPAKGGASGARGRKAAAKAATPAETPALAADSVAPPTPTLAPSPRGAKEAPEWMKRVAARIEAAEAAEASARDALDRVLEAGDEEMAARAATITKRGRGRPTLYDPVLCDLAVECGRVGMEVVEIAVQFGVARDTLYEWAKVHPEFSDALTRAREAAEAWHTARLRFQLGLPAGATNAATYLGYMGRRFAGWRETSEVAHDVADGLAELMGLIDGKTRGLGAPR